MSTTRITRILRAPRARVYDALVDAAAIAQWKFPDGMAIEVHAFDARVGGRFRVSLTYTAPGQAGKTDAHTDTYHGHFKELVPGRRVVDAIEFETSDPAMQGVMTTTITLADADGGGTELTAVHENLPPGISPADNQTGWRMALDRLAAFAERELQQPPAAVPQPFGPRLSPREPPE